MDNKPLLIWLQGGPGVSSFFGMYTEIGPYNIVNNSGVL
jgi:vitellogenic carboxypeptidase-like protein